MIELRHVSKSFGPIRAVQDISFEVHTGQCVGLLGPNGAGKTTTIRMITGYLPPSSGQIRLGAHDTIRESLEARRLIGYLPESTPLYSEMRVGDFLNFRARLYGIAGAARRAAIGKALDLCRLADVPRRRIGHLSKGYRQRVGLASTLLHDPPVLILDEPTSGLDPAQIRETRSLIKDLAARRTVLVSSHILPEVEKTCDRVIIIARGAIRADGAPDELVRSMDESARYLVEVRADQAQGERLERSLGAMAEIAQVVLERSAGDGAWVTLRVQGAPGAADLRERIGREVSAAALSVRELRRLVPTLEQVFVRVIDTDADHPPTPTPTPPPRPTQEAAAA